jgi:hypothetical protein
MNGHESSPGLERSLPDQILSRTLETISRDPDFDKACIARLRTLAADGRISHSGRVIEALQDPD